MGRDEWPAADAMGQPSMSVIKALRQGVSRRWRRHGRYSASLDRLNRLPLLREALGAAGDIPALPTREAMWDHLAAQRPGPIDYLEFGVHEGHSLRHWAGANADPGSRFTGFDTFTGLPDAWNAAHPRGHFATGGRAPVIDDARVGCRTGMFQATLGPFLDDHPPGGRPLVVHLDCDLYGSALYALTRLDPWLLPGTLLILDEFGDVLHEFRALADYCDAYRRRTRLVCTHDNGFTAAVVMR